MVRRWLRGYRVFEGLNGRCIGPRARSFVGGNYRRAHNSVFYGYASKSYKSNKNNRSMATSRDVGGTVPSGM